MSGGFYRDGTFNYYVIQTSKSINDGKATGPFVLASLEVEKRGLIVPPFNSGANPQASNSVVLKWTDKSYNATGFAIERKTNLDDNFKEIARVLKGKSSYTDTVMPSASSVIYRAFAYNDSTVSDYSNEAAIKIDNIDVKGSMNNGFKLYQNYPNPFNPITLIKYSLATRSNTELIIYNITGQKIASLVNGMKFAGEHSVIFNASDFSSGIYFYTLKEGNFLQTKKMILLK
jgi:hypothetical protein